MKTIAIIGANGQVGSEVCLFLAQHSDVKVVPISRSVYGSTLLRHCGLEVRHGSFKSPDEARRLTAGCDLVADFSAPHGNPNDVRAAMTETVGHAIANSPEAKQYVYISSHGIFRHRARQARYRSYAHAKLYGEKLALSAGGRAGKEVYILRLGQVHGVLQGISHDYIAQLRDEEAVLPDVPSLVVFVYSIAEAVLNIAYGKETPGTYTLVSVPAWKPEEVHAYYCGLAGIEPRFRIAPVNNPGLGQAVKRVVRATLEPTWREILAEREFIDDLLLKYAPSTAVRLRSNYYVSRAASEFALKEGLAWRPIEQDFDAPGTRLRSLSDSRISMHEPSRRLAALLETSLQQRLAHLPVPALPSS